MIEVLVSRLGLDSATNSYVVVLQERGGTRLLPIWIGQPEAESIVRHMHNVKGVRPLTHDLVRNLILGMGAQLRRVQITRVEKSTYYAELQLQAGESLVHIDAHDVIGAEEVQLREVGVLLDARDLHAPEHATEADDDALAEIMRQRARALDVLHLHHDRLRFRLPDPDRQQPFSLSFAEDHDEALVALVHAEARDDDFDHHTVESNPPRARCSSVVRRLSAISC
jgi:hypothetical protein